MTNLNLKNNIPKEMQEQKRWICYRLDGTTKKPVSPNTGIIASVTDAANWADFETTVNFLNNHPTTVTGLGYVFAEGDGFVGIDLDYCFTESREFVNEEVNNIISMVDSYIEESVSGKGLHIYVRGTLPKSTGIKISKETSPFGFGVELYEKNRFFAVTGNTFQDHTVDKIPDGQSLIDYLAELTGSNTCQHNNCNITVQPLPQDYEPSAETIDALNERLESNNYFHKLWNGERPKGNESSDDMALMYQLCQISNNNEEILALFQRSEHFKTKDAKHMKKCQRHDYLPRTLANALNYMEHNLSEEELQYTYLVESTNNDAGNGEKFVSMYKNELLFCDDEDKWYHFNRVYWEKISTSKLKKMAQNLQKIFYDLAETLNNADLHKAAYKLGNNCNLNNMIENASCNLTISPDKFNLYRHLIAVNNGIVDLKTGCLVEAKPEYYITQKVPVSYNPNAPEPKRFLQFIDEICCYDKKLTEYMLRLLGYILTGEIKEQAFFIFIGAGANGKSLLVNVLKRILGELAGSISQDAFTLKANGNSLNPSLVTIKNAHVGFVSESNSNQQLDSALIKAISGGDDIQVRQLYQNLTSFYPQFKIIMTTNHLPNFDYSDEAMARRAKIIKFENTFTGENRDDDLFQKLIAEAEGILKLLVEYAVKYYQDGLKDFEPEDIKNNFNLFQVQTNSIQDFIETHLEYSNDSNDYISSTEIYNHYNIYCHLINQKPKSQKVFATFMKQFGFDSAQRTDKRIKCFLNIKYKDEKNLLAAN